MTTPQNEKSMPTWVTASAILLRISNMLFKLAIAAGTMEVDGLRFNAWNTLRRVSVVYFANRSTELEPKMRELMIGALRIAHEVVHNGKPERSIEKCDCAMASEQRELALLLAEDQVAA